MSNSNSYMAYRYYYYHYYLSQFDFFSFIRPTSPDSHNHENIFTMPSIFNADDGQRRASDKKFDAIYLLLFLTFNVFFYNQKRHRFLPSAPPFVAENSGYPRYYYPNLPTSIPWDRVLYAGTIYNNVL